VANDIVLSHVQATGLMRARREHCESVRTSTDLGLTGVEALLSEDKVAFPGVANLGWEVVERIARSPNKCFVVRDGEVEEIRVFSEQTNRVYSLFPTEGAPTMLVSGFTMHRIKGTDPYRDTLEKIKAASPISGRVLDTTTGLGYTAIEAAKRAEKVVTIELDPAALEIARLNPWSRGLFDNPRIEQRIGDSFEEVPKLEASSFSRIIHDPPVLSLAGQLYSGAFYSELYRVLRTGGRLFHYIGAPDSKSGGNTTKGVVRRLQEAGFGRVVPRPQAFGVVAYK
jgi:predicted methyltransferase